MVKTTSCNISAPKIPASLPQRVQNKSTNSQTGPWTEKIKLSISHWASTVTVFLKALSLSRDGTCVCVLSGDGSLGTRKSTPQSCHRHDWPDDKMTKWFFSWSKKLPWVPTKPGLDGLVNTFSGHSMFLNDLSSSFLYAEYGRSRHLSLPWHISDKVVRR